MPANSSTASNLEWLKTTIDWPYELLYAEAHVLPAENINPLERITLEILQAFKEEAPSLQEAAQQLGIVGPAFIEETLKRMLEKGVLQKDQDDPVDLAHCHVTTAQLSDPNSSSAIEKHGVRFCVDAITSEHIPSIYFDLVDQPTQPIIPQQQLPAQRQHLGLDRARQWAADQDEPFLAQAGHMTDIVLLPERGEYAWQPMQALLAIDDQGHMTCQLESGTQLQQAGLDQQDTKEVFSRQLRISALDKNTFSPESPAVSFETWRSHVEQLIPPNRLTKEAIGGIQSAEHTLFIHGFWLGIDSLRKAVLQSGCTKRVVFGPQSVLDRICCISNGSLSKVALDKDHGLSEKAMILADNKWGIRLDRLSLMTSAGQHTDVIVPSLLRTDSVVDFMSEISLC